MQGVTDESGTVRACETQSRDAGREGRGTDGADSPDGGGAVILLIIQRYYRPIN